MQIIRILLGVLRYALYLVLVVIFLIVPHRHAVARPIRNYDSGSGILVIAHIYHLNQAETMLQDISQFINDSPVNVEVVITTTFDRSSELTALKNQILPNSEIVEFENRGRDILPFLKVLKGKNPQQFRLVTKVHTKADRTTVYGRDLHEDSVGRFFDLPTTRKLYDLSSQSSFVATYRDLIFGPLALGKNLSQIRFILKKLMVSRQHLYPTFAAGSMFWMTGDIAQRFVTLDIDSFNFEVEPLADDGMTAHAFERVFGFVTADYDSKVLAVEDL